MKRVALDIVLALGYFSVAAGILIARANPASSYESSVYMASPTATWIGLAIGLAIAVSTTLTCRGRYQAISIGLGAAAVTTIVSLPFIRNYRFAGVGDALSHLGWTRDIVRGDLLPHELFYPGLHSIASAIHFVGGVPLERSVLLMIIVFFVPFLIFIPLTVRELSGNALAIGIAAIISWMILPINNVATHMGAHTNSNALFLVPVVIFAFVAYLKRGSDIERLPLGLSPFSVLIVFASLALLFVHPQQMVAVVVLFGSIGAIQYLARWRFEDHPIVHHPTTYVHTTVLGAIVGIWAISNERFRDSFSGLVYGIFADDVGASAEVDQRGSSLTELGGSLAELFVKMFLEAAVIGLIVAIFLVVIWLGWSAIDLETKAFCTYFGLALIPLGGMFLVYFVGTPTMAFRQVGFIFVILTILAGIAIAHATAGLSKVITTPGANAVVATMLAAFLILGLMTVYASPIIYQPNQHVTDQHLNGYESSYEHALEERPHVGYGADPFRFDHGINGIEEESVATSPYESGAVNTTEFESGNYSGAYDGHDYYFVVSEYDTTRELEVYQGLHHSEAALEGVDEEPSANKVISNDEFRMYAITAADE